MPFVEKEDALIIQHGVGEEDAVLPDQEGGFELISFKREEIKC
ncbi:MULTISPECIES: hypothetical protein [unclassified Mesorhizobium]|nr:MULTISPECIES: hypothetical protein [unclassified Mesorhizobium]